MVDFFAPQQAQPNRKREAERLKTLAESLMQGGQYRGNEMVSGRVVKQSPLEHLARGLQTAGAGYFQGQAQQKLDQADADSGRIFAEALGQMGTDMGAAAQTLAQDPEQRGAAMQMYAQELARQRQEAMQREGWDRQAQLAQMRASSGGNMPAAMQVASRMFELEQAMNNPNLTPQERFLAEREYTLIGQAQKTYAFDRGIEVGSGLGGYADMYGGGIPPVTMDQGQVPSGPLPPSGYPADPVAAHAQAVAQQQQQIGVSPMQRPDLAQPMQSPQIREIPGYTDIMANRAAQKKAEEAQAQAVGKEVGEAEANLQLMESQFPRLQELVGELSALGQQATYTAAGRGTDMVRRELGMEPRQSSIAREEYISKVNNEILPLLRATFGAQFTEREGQRLIQTLGAPNVAPAEKDAVLRSFIQQKEAQIRSLSRQVGREPNIPQSGPQVGQEVDGYVFLGGNPADPNSWRQR